MSYKKMFLGAIFFSLFFVVGLPAVKAISVQELMDQIKALQAQLAQMRSQESATTAWCHNFNTSLGFANSGSDEISSLHTALQKESISYDNDNNNEYGEDTAAAVVKFQAKYGIRQTGYVGPLTRAKLSALYGCKTTTPPVVTPPSAALPTVNVTINNSSGPVVSLNDGQTFTLAWTSTNAVSCYAYANGNLMNNLVLDGVANNFQGQTSGSVLGQAMAAKAPIMYTVKCSNTAGQQASNSITFQVSPAIQPSITVTSPNGGEQLVRGSQHKITWSFGSSYGFGTDVMLESANCIAQGLGTSINPDTGIISCQMSGASVALSIAVDSNSLTWTVGKTLFSNYLVNAGNYYVRVCKTGTDICDRSDNSLSIVSSATVSRSIIVQAPVTGTNLRVGQLSTVLWSESPATNTTYTLRDFATQQVIATLTSGQANCAAQGNICSFAWTPTQAASNTYIAISDYTNSVYGSSGYFSVLSQNDQSPAPIISSISPSTGGSGQQITIYGNNLSGVSQITFYSNNQMMATITSPSISAQDQNHITFTISSMLAANVDPGTYQVRATTPSGMSNSMNFTLVSATSTLLPTVNLTVNGSSGSVAVASGSTMRVVWTSSNATTCTKPGFVNGTGNITDTSGDATFPAPAASGTYSVTCSNVAGSASSSITVNVTTSSAGQGNSGLTAQRLFVGQYDNTRYSLTLTDPDGLGDIFIKKADGGHVWSGSPRNGNPQCPASINSGTMTFSPSDFPLSGTVVDCKSSVTYSVSVQMPGL